MDVKLMLANSLVNNIWDNECIDEEDLRRSTVW